MKSVIKKNMSFPKSKIYTCECGSSIKNLYTSISQHKKSAKHIKYVEANQIQIPETPKVIITENKNSEENVSLFIEKYYSPIEKFLFHLIKN